MTDELREKLDELSRDSHLTLASIMNARRFMARHLHNTPPVIKADMINIADALNNTERLMECYIDHLRFALAEAERDTLSPETRRAVDEMEALRQADIEADQRVQTFAVGDEVEFVSLPPGTVNMIGERGLIVKLTGNGLPYRVRTRDWYEWNCSAENLKKVGKEAENA